MLRFIAISGTTSVTHNMYVYETKDEMLVVDCGMGFPDISEKGIDLVLPDYSYVVKNKRKLKGVLLSHGHEDHIGAVPFLLKEIDFPIWCTRLVARFLEEKIKNYKLKKPQINVFSEKGDEFNIGKFKINSFGVTHSIPETQGFSIDTPEGRVMHVAEHKVSKSLVGPGFDEERIKELSKDILFLASDSLNANKKGFVSGEDHIEANLENIFKKAPRAIFFTAISSNIARFNQVIKIAGRLGRKISFVGYSIRNKCQIARDLGYLSYSDEDIIRPREAMSYNPEEVLYIVGGCFGQKDSSLTKISTDDHHIVSAEKEDMVVFSQDPAPPYTKEAQDAMVDNFTKKGVDVYYYATSQNIYVSGHGYEGDMLKLFELVNAKYAIPVGGTIRFMKSYRRIAERFGFDSSNVFELYPGESVVFENKTARKGKTVPVKSVYVDGEGVGDVGKKVLFERDVLSEGGVVIAVIRLKDNKFVGKTELITKGFVFEKIKQKLLKNASEKLDKKLRSKINLDKSASEKLALDVLYEHFFKKIGRKPMIVPVIINN